MPKKSNRESLSELAQKTPNAFAPTSQGGPSEGAHSAQFLTDVRDLWWNLDQLERIAERLDPSGVRDALDVGAGRLHWTRTIARLFPKETRWTAVERDPKWVEETRALSTGRDLRVIEGDASKLPLGDKTMDLVTCQTLLIHVDRPREVLGEMARVLRPGGRLWLNEPNNLSATAAFASPSADVEDLVAAFRLHATCEKGKHALGLGYTSLGETLLGLLDPGLWTDLEVRVCDRARSIVAPHDDAMRSNLADERRQFESAGVGWGPDETLRYFLAGGGDPSAFGALWDRAYALTSGWLDELERGERALAGGSLLYAVTARRR